MNILVVGTGAREHALVWKLAQHPEAIIFNYGPTHNPGIAQFAKEIGQGILSEVVPIVQWAQEQRIDVVWIGPEEPLAVGLVDALEGCGIACIGPTQRLAQLESSKSFTRQLVERHRIPGSPKYRVFTSLDGIEDFLNVLQDQCVVKPDGLTGGKGVKVMGDQLHHRMDVLQYCTQLFAAGDQPVVIEEKLIGQEFSLMSFSDGNTLCHMPPIQDHKRALVDDQGANTGGMGSYGDRNNTLPFLTPADITAAQLINEQVIQAVQQEYDEEYRGVLYGGFMAVSHGVRLIEYNVRFGDPEVMNLLSTLDTDLVAITQAMLNKTLHKLKVTFNNKASVCKYAVPTGYPEQPVKNQPIDVSQVNTGNVNLFYGSVEQTEQSLIEKGSRTVAVVGVADTLAKAEQFAEAEIQKITGPLMHRSDIGTAGLIQKRVEQMKQLRASRI